MLTGNLGVGGITTLLAASGRQHHGRDRRRQRATAGSTNVQRRHQPAGRQRAPMHVHDQYRVDRSARVDGGSGGNVLSFVGNTGRGGHRRSPSTGTGTATGHGSGFSQHRRPSPATAANTTLTGTVGLAPPSPSRATGSGNGRRRRSAFGGVDQSSPAAHRQRRLHAGQALAESSPAAITRRQVAPIHAGHQQGRRDLHPDCAPATGRCDRRDQLHRHRLSLVGNNVNTTLAGPAVGRQPSTWPPPATPGTSTAPPASAA